MGEHLGLNPHEEPFSPDSPWKENQGPHADGATELSEGCHLPPNVHIVHLPTTDGS